MPTIPKIELSFSAFPTPPNRLSKGFNVVTASGALIFFFIPLFTLIAFLNEIMKEKEKKLRIVSSYTRE